MAIDTSIYAQANSPAVKLRDPAEVLQQLAQTQSAVNQNRLFQAQQARGNALQQATDPQTGRLDPLAAQRLLAQAGAVGAPAMADMASQSQALQGAQNDLAQKQAAYLTSTLDAAQAVPDDKLHDFVGQAIQRGIQMGVMQPDRAIAVALGLSNDPAQLRQQMQVMRLQQMSPAERQSQIYGTPAEQGTGGAIVAGVRQPAAQGGGFVPSTTTPMSLSPGEATAPTPLGVTPGGAPIVGTRQQFIDKAGGTSPLGTGRLPDALRNPNRPNAAAPAGGAPASPGIVTGVGPAQESALAASGAASAKAFADITDAGKAAQDQGAVLGNMLGDTTQFTSGTTALNKSTMFLQRQAPAIARAFGIDPAKVAANESFDKLASQIANAQGAGTDARLAVAQVGNPSSHNSQEGVDLILRQLQGNADFAQARAKVASIYPDKADRAGFEANVASKLDPRAFQFDRMTPDQRTIYAKSLSAPDQLKVRAAYIEAGRQGLLSSGWRPNGQ